MSEWQPIETAPRDGTAVLVWCAQSLVTQPAYFSASAGMWRVTWNSDKIWSEPTEWMPLPEPPRDG